MKLNLNNIISLVQRFVKKDDGLVLIGGWFGQRYADNSRYLYEFLRENKSEYSLKKVVWVTENKSVYNELKKSGRDAVVRKSARSLILHLRARFHIVDQGGGDIWAYLSASDQTIKINLWHGFPMKKIGAFSKYGLSTKIEKGNWQNQKVLTCSEFGHGIIGKAFGVDESRSIKGMYPRNHFLLNPITYLLKEEKRLMEVLDKEIHAGKKIIFYLPTFRDEAEIKLFGEEDEATVEFLAFLEREGYFLFTKLHYGGTHILPRRKDRVSDEVDVLNIPSHIDVCPFLKKSDILITDYSGVLFDYLYLDKDIIFFPYDLDFYMNEDRGLLLDYDEFTPGNKVYNLEELKVDLIGKKVKRDGYAAGRDQLRRLCFEHYEMGETAKNILCLSD